MGISILIDTDGLDIEVLRLYSEFSSTPVVIFSPISLLKHFSKKIPKGSHDTFG